MICERFILQPSVAADQHAVKKVLLKKALLTCGVKQTLSQIPHKPVSIIWHLHAFLPKKQLS